MKYHLTRRAEQDMARIWDRIANDNGVLVADRIEQKLHAAMRLLAEVPGAGHTRDDVTRAHYRFWSVKSFVIAYRIDRKPIAISRVIHGARDFKRLFR
ncbi:MAG TPA: type II toxin-antitoxin system RelE/ParE family toxin [Tepidisphaeraceae bacterium]|jgi:plasmid stabilization system protein ParE